MATLSEFLPVAQRKIQNPVGSNHVADRLLFRPIEPVGAETAEVHMLILYVDADACPVKDEIYRVARPIR